ncbi:MAG: hypothetical protein KAT91_00270 [Candidatus Aenigmarchaeota archaeon]|nr:hypothetical protein [Candidatus Aenigmarchaeota archaeon]
MEEQISKYSLKPHTIDDNSFVDKLYDLKKIPKPIYLENDNIPELCSVTDLIGVSSEIERFFMGYELEDDWVMKQLKGLEEPEIQTILQKKNEKLYSIWTLINEQLTTYADHHKKRIELTKTGMLNFIYKT